MHCLISSMYKYNIKLYVLYVWCVFVGQPTVCGYRPKFRFFFVFLFFRHFNTFEYAIVQIHFKRNLNHPKSPDKTYRHVCCLFFYVFDSLSIDRSFVLHMSDLMRTHCSFKVHSTEREHFERSIWIRCYLPNLCANPCWDVVKFSWLQ